MAKAFTDAQWKALTPEQRKKHNTGTRGDNLLKRQGKYYNPDGSLSANVHEMRAKINNGTFTMNKKQFNETARKVAVAKRNGLQTKGYSKQETKLMKSMGKRTYKMVTTADGRRVKQITGYQYDDGKGNPKNGGGPRKTKSGKTILRTRTVKRNGKTVKIHTVKKGSGSSSKSLGVSKKSGKKIIRTRVVIRGGKRVRINTVRK